MKSFDEFLSTELASEEMKKITKVVFDSMEEEFKELSADKPLSYSEVANLLHLEASVDFIMRILRKYHDWLSKQL